MEMLMTIWDYKNDEDFTRDNTSMTMSEAERYTTNLFDEANDYNDQIAREYTDSEVTDTVRANRLRDLEYESDGVTLKNTDGASLWFKNKWNKFVDAVNTDDNDGGWSNNDFKLDTYLQGSKVDYSNKQKADNFADYSLDDLVTFIKDAKENPNAESVFYGTRHYDGKDADGNDKYLYKYGIHKVSAYDRYKTQLGSTGDEIFFEKRIAGAEHFESAFNLKAHEYRAFDLGKDKKDPNSFGSGYTELRTKELLGIDFDTIDLDAIATKSKKVSDDHAKYMYNKGNRRDDSLIDSFQVGASSLGLDIADLFTTVVSG